MIPTSIIVHHSLTKDSETVSWGAIRKYHLSLGWQNIGYHAGIELIGDKYEILLGRLWDQSGAHCHQEGMNFTSLGLCLIGDFDQEPPDNEQLILAENLCKYWMKLFNISKDKVYRHSDFAKYKSCPGKLFPWAKFVAALV
jgi:hypothetical protein